MITNLVIERISVEGFRRFAAEIRDLLALPNMSSDRDLDTDTQRALVQRFDDHCASCLEFNDVVMARKAPPIDQAVIPPCFLDQREFPWHELTERANKTGRRVTRERNYVDGKWEVKDVRPFPTTYGEVLSIGRQEFSQQQNCGDKTLEEFDQAMDRAGLLHEWTMRYRHGRKFLGSDQR